MSVHDYVSSPLTRVEFAVLMSGIASMGLEILAGRMITPAYGSSIFTWGSIIGVFLTALSLGYWVGGKRASSRASRGRLAGVLSASAAYVAFVIFMQGPILDAGLVVDIPPQYSPLIPVTLLFGPPIYILGFISPYGAHLSQKEDIGEASGHVYALGTIGSIIGTFWTTFHLVPAYSINMIAFIFGVLLLLSAAILAYDDISLKSASIAAVVAVLLISSLVVPSAVVATPGQTIHEEQSTYQQITVAQEGEIRTLYSDGQPHSAMNMSSPDTHVLSYSRYLRLPWLMADESDQIDRVLIIGGGGFTSSRRIVANSNATVDVVEIDPTMIEVSKEYFHLNESDQLNVINAPGRRYLRNTNRTYDMIVMDAYKKTEVPFQLTTVEFMELASDHLSENGFMHVNLISSQTGAASQIYKSEYRSMNKVFPQVYSFPTEGNVSEIQNIELIATKNATRISQSELQHRNRDRTIGINLSSEIERYKIDIDTEGAKALRDDWAPVDHLMSPMIGRTIQPSTVNETNSP
ncbi:Spermine synthase protein [Halorhabdus tiamatea SARL4B]|uniref:Spermine synthase protein n=1 Tax=Halorhabdus tiamatea SARL4B TaxID=1033806 RepID=F7PMJ7_9EURY|nr:fused MFS/spermidine synthase [Halorhabdus tiamatea]ERJ07397.1 Spermine synthase protein [Halorhabdus tiamatea SARL4B]